MTAEVDHVPASESEASPSPRRGFWRVVRESGIRPFSSLTRRIVILNLAGLVALVGGILYLNQFREGLIDARVQALLTQGEIMASAVAASATVETGAIRIDPEKLLEQQAQDDSPADDSMQSLEFPINPEKGRAAAASADLPHQAACPRL